MKVSTTFCNDFSIIRSKQFHQKSVNSKIIIFRSLNAIYGKVGRNTSDFKSLFVSAKHSSPYISIGIDFDLINASMTSSDVFQYQLYQR